MLFDEHSETVEFIILIASNSLIFIDKYNNTKEALDTVISITITK